LWALWECRVSNDAGGWWEPLTAEFLFVGSVPPPDEAPDGDIDPCADPTPVAPDEKEEPLFDLTDRESARLAFLRRLALSDCCSA